MRGKTSNRPNSDSDQAPIVEGKDESEEGEDLLLEEVEEEERARHKYRGPYRKAWTPKPKKR